MKYNIRLLCRTLVLCFVYQTGMSQDGNEITIPSTPAFSILNYEPASVMRPSNPKELSADILNSIDKNGTLLLNLGIEVSPYWLTSRPALTRKQYLEAKGIQAIIQSFTLSAATVKDSISKNNKLGVGFRFKLTQGDQTQQSVDKEQELVERATLMALVTNARGSGFNTRDSLVLSIEQNLRLSHPPLRSNAISLWRKIMLEEWDKFGDSAAEVVRFAEAINDRIAEENLALQKQVVALARKRTGIITEIAGASSFITTSTDRFEKIGLWLNVSNVISQTDAWSFTARYFYAVSDSSTINFDLGTSYIKELSDFSVSVEGMARYYQSQFSDINIDNEPITRVESKFTYRLAVQAAYRISSDISVNLSLGKDFDSPFLNRSGFFSIFGVNYTLFKNSTAMMP